MDGSMLRIQAVWILGQTTTNLIWGKVVWGRIEVKESGINGEWMAGRLGWALYKETV